MRIPRVLYGRRGEMKKRMAPLVKALADGEEVESWDFGPMMLADEDPDAALLTNPGRAGTQANDFHCYALLYAVMEGRIHGKLSSKHFEDAFAWSLNCPWAFVGAVGEAGARFFLKMKREADLQEARARVGRGAVRAVGIVSVALIVATSTGCGGTSETNCESARAKLDECPRSPLSRGQIEMLLTHLVVAPECDDVDECVARCVQPASCDDIAFALRGSTDPNSSMPPGGESFHRCVVLCSPR